LRELTCVEVCAGGGGQSLGLERAGFSHLAVVEIDSDACQTLRLNRPHWNVVNADIHSYNCREHEGVDLFAGGVPCPPFSIAGKQLGADDERDLFPRALELIEQCNPTAIVLENVRGLASARFTGYREQVLNRLTDLGYRTHWQLLNACEFGVPQLRPRFVLVGVKPAVFPHFSWPQPVAEPVTVGETLRDLMASGGWAGAAAWADQASGIGPTLVGGSRKHGGPDLGPTRARRAWLSLRVDGRGIANELPTEAHPADHLPRLTLAMTALLQGFPLEWQFWGRKTAAYRQIGNAFPPPVAQALGEAIAAAIRATAESGTSPAGQSLARSYGRAS
jgi:DNA (cytosine-5)-methyltransferase 1